MTDPSTRIQDSDDELSAMLRQMFDEHPVPAAPVDLARRARRLATQLNRAELDRLERIRRWAFGVTMAAALVIFSLAGRLVVGTFKQSGFRTSSNLSTGSQLLVVIAVAGAAVVVGVLIVGPALSTGDA